MKMKTEHYSQLKAMVESSRQFDNLMEYTSNGLSNMRYRWDCVWSIDSNIRRPLFDELYKYLNDDHIDTALRRITNTTK